MSQKHVYIHTEDQIRDRKVKKKNLIKNLKKRERDRKGGKKIQKEITSYFH